MPFLMRDINDRRGIKLCRQWLQAGVIENGKYYTTEKVHRKVESLVRC